MRQFEPEYPDSKPIFLFVLAVLSLISGVGILVLFISNFDKLNNVVGSSIGPTFGISLHVLIFSILVIVVLALGFGLGTFLRKKWGWWFGSVYFLSSIVRYSNAIFTIRCMAEDFGASPEEINKHVTKFVIRIIINSLCLAYYFKPNVLYYFWLENSSKKGLLLKIAGITFTLWLIGSILAAL